MLIVPGIIAAYEYRFVFEIFEEHTEWSYKEVMKASKEMTHGYKFELFVLDLSFILWELLVGFVNIFTFGLATYLLQPYTYMTNVFAYLKLRDRSM